MTTIFRFIFLFCLALPPAFILVFLPRVSPCEPSNKYFPSFRSIQNNVHFWEKVYSHYSTATAVMHDRNDPSIVYEEIAILDSRIPGSARINQLYITEQKEEYRKLLVKLAAGQAPEGTREKHVAGMFPGPRREEDMRKAADSIRSQTGLKERFAEGVLRSGAYKKSMQEIFASHGLPTDLFYLAHVESSFDYNAHSKYGASGIWQFTRSTGKNYLTINSLIDERRDPLLATQAAAQYLKYNFTKLGTWPLAITAYNYGHAGMQRALDQQKTYENIFKHYSDGHFGFASRNFYSEFVAARNVAKRLERQLHDQMHAPMQTTTLRLPGYISAAALVAHLQIETKTLRHLNPALLAPIWNEEKFIPPEYKLRVPANASLIPLFQGIPHEAYHARQKESTLYTVQSGDTQSAIAAQFGIGLSLLQKANNLTHGDLLYTGTTLRIPIKAAEGEIPLLLPSPENSKSKILKGNGKFLR